MVRYWRAAFHFNSIMQLKLLLSSLFIDLLTKISNACSLSVWLSEILTQLMLFFLVLKESLVRSVL